MRVHPLVEVIPSMERVDASMDADFLEIVLMVNLRISHFVEVRVVIP